MSLFNDNCFYLPKFIASKIISNGAKLLYIYLYDDYGDVNKFEYFIPSYYIYNMHCSSRTLYRYFTELLNSGCIFKQNGYYVFLKDIE